MRSCGSRPARPRKSNRAAEPLVAARPRHLFRSSLIEVAESSPEKCRGHPAVCFFVLDSLAHTCLLPHALELQLQGGLFSGKLRSDLASADGQPGLPQMLGDVNHQPDLGFRLFLGVSLLGQLRKRLAIGPSTDDNRVASKSIRLWTPAKGLNAAAASFFKASIRSLANPSVELSTR